MARPIIRKTDLIKIRDVNLAIVKNEDGDYTPADIARASRVISQLKQIELRIEALVGKTPAERHVEPQPALEGEPLIYTLDHLTKNA